MKTIDYDFETMISMLKEIQENIKNVKISKSYQFINPIKNMILEAYLDSCNKEDSFLFPKQN